MDICAIIAEYNPFHNGHAINLSHAKQHGKDGVIAIMSGNFVQRGGPAIYDKWIRSHMAVASGVDLVIELPTVYAMATAEIFAKKSIEIIDKLGCVNHICFGIDGDTSYKYLREIAEIINDDNGQINESIKRFLKTGVSYPTAYSMALREIYAIKYSINTPNSILALEYIKAILKFDSPLSIHSIKREKTGYHDLTSKDNVASATGIRNILQNDNDLNNIEGLMPKLAYDVIKNENPVFSKDYSQLILGYLRMEDKEKIKSIADVSEGLEERIKTAAQNSATYEELLFQIKTKRYTMSKIERVIWSSLLSIKPSHQKSSPSYARVLAMNETGKKLLSIMRKTATIDVVTKAARLKGNEVFELEATATDLYYLSNKNSNFSKGRREFLTSPIIV